MLQVIGDPIFHSKSPIIQTTMLDHLGLDIPYTPHWVKKGELADYFAFAQANGVTGFNATMPHKEDLVPMMDELGEEAIRYGAVNTVCLREGRRIGHNTDGDGCLSSLVRAGMWPARQVVLLGAGGLLRAYTRSAKDALDAAGISVVRRWVALAIPCGYNLFEQIRLQITSFGGVPGEVDYGADVCIHALHPEERAEEFAAHLLDFTAGTVTPQPEGERFQDVPWKEPVLRTD